MADWPENYGASFAIPHDQLMASLQPMPQKGVQIVPLYGHADELEKLRAYSEALEALRSPSPFDRRLAPQAAAFSSLPQNYGSPATILPDWLWGGTQPAPAQQLN